MSHGDVIREALSERVHACAAYVPERVLSPGTDVRQPVLAFAALMERELQANAHKDNDARSNDFNYLLGELRTHVEKFAGEPTSEHAADVGNLAMLALAVARAVLVEGRKDTP